MSRTIILSGFLFSVISLGGCGVQVDVPGNEGNLIFSYLNGNSCDTPIAVGAKRVVKVTDTNKEAVRILTAKGGDDSIVSVGKISGGQVILEALKEGSIRLDLETKNGSAELVDNIDLSSKIADRTNLNDGCGEGESVFLFEQEKHKIDFKLYSGDDSVGGYGYYPFELSAGVLDLESTDPVSLHFTMPAEMPADAEIKFSSTIDDEELVIKLITESDIDSVEIGLADVTPTTLEAEIEGEDRVCVLLLSETMGDQICRAKPQLELEALTPETCAVAGSDNLGPVLPAFGAGWACFTPLKDGECDVKMTLPRANGGEGISVEHSFTVTVEE